MKVEQHASRRQFSVGKQILFSAIIGSALLIGAEGAIRLWVLCCRTSYERLEPGTGRLELVPNIRSTNARGEEFWINSKGFVGPEFTNQPADGVYRIIAVGDSCTFSEGLWRFAYPGILEHYLNAAAGHRRFEVINAGIEGYNSTLALERIEQELIGYKPDLVLVYIGWNDLMKVDPRNATAAGKYTMLARIMERSYLVRAYRKVMFVYLRPLLFRPRVGVDDAGVKAYDEFVPAAYQENLRAMEQALTRNGIDSMLLTLPTVVRPSMTREDLERERVLFPYFAGTYSVGEFLSLHRAYDRVVRGVAKSSKSSMVDLDELFDKQDKRPLFWDTMHPSRKGHCFIAAELFKRIGSRFGLSEEIPREDGRVCG